MQPASASRRPRRQSRGLLRIASVRGVPVLVAPSWLLVGALLTAAYGPLIENSVPSVGRGLAYVAALGFALVFGLCVLAHECGHTLVGVALGHPVRRIVLFALGGVSEIDDDPDRPRDELLVSLAGPAVSLVIAAAGYLGTLAASGDGLVGVLCGLLGWTNLLLAAFNLLPGLPLDGGRVVRALLALCGVPDPRSTVVTAWIGRAVAVALAASALLVDRTTLGVSAGVLGVAVALYLWFAAGLAVRTARLTARLPDVHVPDLLRAGVFVAADVSLAEALRRAGEHGVRGIVVVDEHERPVAIVEESQLESVPDERRAWVPVTSVARPLADGLVLPDGLDGRGLLRRMRDVPAGEYLVVHDDGSPAGIIATRDFARQLTGPDRPPTREILT